VEIFLHTEDAFYEEVNGVGIIRFPMLMEYKELLHCYTTRIGGVSEGSLGTLNLSFNRGEAKEKVLKNYVRLADALGIKLEQMVLSDQVHGKKARVVGRKDLGKGLIRESDILKTDGLVTASPNVALVTFYADCVPLYFYDPVKKVIALSHSGWRSTLKNIAGETVRVMKEKLGSLPENIVVQIGPHIGNCCFEVGEDVYSLFINEFPWADIYAERQLGKYFLNLTQIIKRCLEDAGVKRDKIRDAKICTKCNKDLIFSHRGSKGDSGLAAALLMLRM